METRRAHQSHGPTSHGGAFMETTKLVPKTRWNCKLYTDNEAQYYALSLPISASSLPTATAVSGYRLEIGRAFV